MLVGSVRRDGSLIERRKCRATGTYMYLEYAPSADAEQPYLTVCEEHGGVCSHESLRLARSFLAAPAEWCEDCAYGPGTLDGSKEA